jgi:hypothetical protein
VLSVSFAQKKERSGSVSVAASKTDLKLKKLKKKVQEKNKVRPRAEACPASSFLTPSNNMACHGAQELKDTLIAKEQERLEKELYAKRVSELEEALAKLRADSTQTEQLEGTIKLLQSNVEAEAQLLRERIVAEEQKEATRKVRCLCLCRVCAHMCACACRRM